MVVNLISLLLLVRDGLSEVKLLSFVLSKASADANKRLLDRKSVV